MSVVLSIDQCAEIIATTKRIIARHPHKTGALLNILNDVQDRYRYLPEPALETISSEMGTSLKLLHAFGSFFDRLSLDPVGRYLIEVCDGTACHTLGSTRILQKFSEVLGIEKGETTPDGRITLKTVNCVGACGIAPVVVAAGEVYGHVGITRVPEIANAVLSIDDEERDTENEAAVFQIETASKLRDRSVALMKTEANGSPCERISAMRSYAKKIASIGTVRVGVGMGTCGRAAGAEKIFALLQAELDDTNDGCAKPEAHVVCVGCRGLCSQEPVVDVTSETGESELFGLVDESCAHAIIALVKNRVDESAKKILREHRIDSSIHSYEERRVLSNCGLIDPFSIAEYIACGGYSALASVLENADCEAVIEQVRRSGLRGRGGAGFSTGHKWAFCVRAQESAKAGDSKEPRSYFIVNGDEGDPGAYMDRGLLESDPHRVLEGLIIGAYAVGASQAYFFIRAEYSLAVTTVAAAINAAYACSLLGDHILGSEFSLNVEIVRGAGAFLNGESTAMVNVLENKACIPRKKPPHMTEAGLWEIPTCLNNVETLANVPLIIEHGDTWFRSVGTKDSPGTKVFSVTGSVERSGLVEVPLGISLGELVCNIAHARNSKAVQIGGPSGEILPTSMTDLEMSYEGLESVEGMMGSGGFVVLSQEQCVVDTALYLTRFCASQSCRRDKWCGTGMDEAAEIIENVTRGVGTAADLERVEELAIRNQKVTLCGLGKTGLNPALSSLRFFRDEYMAHLDKRCPGLVCIDLISYSINKDKCQGERCCLTTCPGNAIKGSFGKPGHIVARLCQKCGMCLVACPYGAVEKVTPAARR